MDFEQAAPSASHQYVGNRVRCWEVTDSLHVSADLESHGIITRIPATSQHRLSCNGLDDLYFHYDLGPVDERAMRGSVLDFDPSRNSLVEFSEAYQLVHPKAVFTKGRINVHYCAWPMSMIDRPLLKFRTPEDRLYRWKALPFDMPMASRAWQYYVNHEINNKLPFVRLAQITLVICAEDRGGAKASLKALVTMAEEHGWTFSVPSPASWTSDVKRLGLESLWEGVRPAL